MFANALPGRRPASVRDRRRLASIRLLAAHRRFERSVATLRRAALDQVDSHVLMSAALRMEADTLAARTGL